MPPQESIPQECPQHHLLKMTKLESDQNSNTTHMKKIHRTETLTTPHKYNHQNQDNKKYARNEKKTEGEFMV